jgi:hypothetical protein
VRPAECKADIASVGELAIAGITVDLQNALEALQMGDGPFGFAIGCVDVNDARWITAAPRPVVSGIGPKLTGLGAPPGQDLARPIRESAGFWSD